MGTSTDYRQLEGTIRRQKAYQGYECAHLPPHPLLLAISVTNTRVWLDMLAREEGHQSLACQRRQHW